MLKRLRKIELTQLLERIAADYQLHVPVQQVDGSRILQPWGSGELSLCGALLQRKPTADFFPQTELLLSIADDGTVSPPPPAAKPLALFGLSHLDLAGIAFLDRFFAAPPADTPYLNRRRNALLIGLAGAVGTDRRWLAPAEKQCDFEVVVYGKQFLALPCSSVGEDWLAPFPKASAATLARVKKRSTGQHDQRIGQLQRASRLLAEDRVPESFWEEIASRCILCSGCNLVCPTCSCFEVQDRRRGTQVERSRIWDSCQFDAFMREASGHNPLGTEALRTRRRIHHKLVADPQRWGELGCVACGRCDRACPTGIGIFAITEELLNRYDSPLAD